MTFRSITKKRFENKVGKLLYYLQTNWGDNVAIDFKILLVQKLEVLSTNTEVGRKVNSIKNVRSILITKHNHV